MQKLCQTQKKALCVRCAFIFKVCTVHKKKKKEMEVTNISFVSQSRDGGGGGGVIFPNAWSLP